MARIRTIKPEFFDDEDIAAMSFPARLAFIGLWGQADRDGRLKDRPVRLKARIFPFDDIDMNGILEEIARHHFIQRYSVDGHALIQVRTFEKHQQINGKEAESVLPGPPAQENSCSTEVFLLGREGKGRERKGTEDSAVPPRVTTPTLLTFPVVGMNGSTWDLTQRQFDVWAQAYPGLDIMAECRKALVWLDAKPGRKKTARGMAAFLVGWFNKATDRGGGSGAPVSARQPGQIAAWQCWHTPKCGDQAEHKRRAQEQIDACIARKAKQPV